MTFENVTCIRATDAAILCECDDWEEDIWFPQSQVHADSEVHDDDENSEGKLVVTEWIAIQKGLL